MTAPDNPLPAVVAAPMLLDDLMPAFDASRVEHRVVDGSVPDVYRSVLEADFISAWKDSVAMRALFAARSAAEELVSRVRGRDAGQPPDLASMRLADMPTRGEYVKLGEAPPREIAFGMAGRFWGGETNWTQIEAAEFVAFREPGLARIACNFSLRDYGTTRTLLSYEARTQANDDESRRQFLRYWKAVSPGVGVVMRSMLAAIKPPTAG